MAMNESKERKVKHQVESLKKANRKIKDLTSRQLTTRLKNTILSIDGSEEQKDINHFVDNELFAVDSRALRAYIAKVTPDIDLTIESSYILKSSTLFITEMVDLILVMFITFLFG